MHTDRSIRSARVPAVAFALAVTLSFLLSACQPVRSSYVEPVQAEPAGATIASPPVTSAAQTPSLEPTVAATGTEVAAAPTAAGKPARRPRVKTEIVVEKLESKALAGNLLGDPSERNIQVILPPSYATSTQRYPVVYALHDGYRDDSYAFTLKTDYENALRNAEAKEMILVIPNANNRLMGSWYLSSPALGDYETYISQEVIDFIDAKYRTLPSRASRGVTGCGMGGGGALHIGFKYPGVFGAAAAMSGFYDWREGFDGTAGALDFPKPPADETEFQALPWEAQIAMARAAGAAPNSNKPPFYIDMPWEIVDGQSQPVAGVIDKITAAAPRADAETYVKQPQRLDAILVYQGRQVDASELEHAQAFDAHLTELGIEHQYLENDMAFCSEPGPIFSFMSDQLVFDQP